MLFVRVCSSLSKFEREFSIHRSPNWVIWHIDSFSKLGISGYEYLVRDTRTSVNTRCDGSLDMCSVEMVFGKVDMFSCRLIMMNYQLGD